MIPRSRSAATPAPARTRLAVTPRDRAGALPSFNPAVPAGGWTVETVYTASREYAESQPGDTRQLTGAAYRALLAASTALKRQEVTERLRDVDRLRAPAAAEIDDDPLPF
jgi:hypothetical protein